MKPARSDAVTKVKLNACLKWALVTRQSKCLFFLLFKFFRDQLLIFYFCPIMLPVSAFVL